MSNKIVYFFVLFFCIISCTPTDKENQGISIDKFPLEVRLQATELKVPPILFKPSNMGIIDTFLVITQSRHDTIFSVFSLPECKYLMSFGNEGRGPNEFNLSFENVTFGPVNNDSCGFAVGNMMTRIQYYRIDDLLKRKPEPYRIERLPPELNGFRAMVYFGDSLIIGAPYRGNMNLFKYTSSDHQLISFQDYPMKFPLMYVESIREVFGLSMAVKPDNSKFVLAYQNFGKIEIYDLKKSQPLIVSYKGFPEFEKNTGLNESSKGLINNPEQIVFCEGIRATNKYIYISIANDKVANIYTRTGPNRNFIREIHVFDWSGNPVVKLKTDRYYHCYDIDPANEYLYTVNDTIADLIYRYDLRKILN
jgi:hypothetical protein